jgi:hypothetical protein
MLRLLAAGLMTSADGRVFRRRFVLELLMSFAGSAMADAFTRRLVMQVSIGCEYFILQPTLNIPSFLLMDFWLCQKVLTRRL